jgi:hypothetical protein
MPRAHVLCHGFVHVSPTFERYNSRFSHKCQTIDWLVSIGSISVSNNLSCKSNGIDMFLSFLYTSKQYKALRTCSTNLVPTFTDLHLVNLKPSPACICGHGF